LATLYGSIHQESGLYETEDCRTSKVIGYTIILLKICNLLPLNHLIKETKKKGKNFRKAALSTPTPVVMDIIVPHKEKPPSSPQTEEIMPGHLCEHIRPTHTHPFWKNNFKD
jgi:hypothetical protein